MKFVTDDGKVFESADEAKNHEQELAEIAEKEQAKKNKAKTKYVDMLRNANILEVEYKDTTYLLVIASSLESKEDKAKLISAILNESLGSQYTYSTQNGKLKLHTEYTVKKFSASAGALIKQKIVDTLFEVKAFDYPSYTFDYEGNKGVFLNFTEDSLKNDEDEEENADAFDTLLQLLDEFLG